MFSVHRPSEAVVPRPSVRYSSLFPLLFLAMLFISALYFAPYYLVFSQKPEKSDAVILLVGGTDEARFREAEQLVRKGYAESVIIPAFNQVLRAESNRSLTKALSPSVAPAGAFKTSEGIENTHLEIAQARRIMEGLGFTSAIFVSSPYHMRRIKIIAEKVFRGRTNSPALSLYFVASRYETSRLRSWFLNTLDLKFVSSEYAKMAWFLIYTYFPGS